MAPAWILIFLVLRRWGLGVRDLYRPHHENPGLMLFSKGFKIRPAPRGQTARMSFDILRGALGLSLGTPLKPPACIPLTWVKPVVAIAFAILRNITNGGELMAIGARGVSA